MKKRIDPLKSYPPMEIVLIRIRPSKYTKEDLDFLAFRGAVLLLLAENVKVFGSISIELGECRRGMPAL
jgi:hypothetical protein